MCDPLDIDNLLQRDKFSRDKFSPISRLYSYKFLAFSRVINLACTFFSESAHRKHRDTIIFKLLQDGLLLFWKVIQRHHIDLVETDDDRFVRKQRLDALEQLHLETEVTEVSTFKIRDLGSILKSN